jgi:uncharacterized glyoxalase superfamily protein PhnB
MRMTTYVTFDGRCEAAFNFYTRVLGGRIAMLDCGGVRRMRFILGCAKPSRGDDVKHDD